MKLIAIFVIVIMMVCSANAAFGLPDAGQLTDNSSADSSADVAIDSYDVAHYTYERDGNVYYQNSADKAEILIGPGSDPNIDVDSSGIAWVALAADGGVKLYNAATGDKYNIADTGFAPRLAISGTTIHLAYMGPSDYSNGVKYAKFDGSQVTESYEICGSWYRHYCTDPSIDADPAGNYHWVARVHDIYCWYGCDHSYWSHYGTSANGGYGFDFEWGGLTKNAITADENGIAHIVYDTGGSIYQRSIDPSAGSKDAERLAEGGAASVSSHGSTLGVAYTYNGQVYYIEDDGSGWGDAYLIDDGSNPAVALGSQAIAYEKNDGSDLEIFTYASGLTTDRDGDSQVPEFGLYAGVIALIGALGIFMYKRE